MSSSVTSGGGTSVTTAATTRTSSSAATHWLHPDLQETNDNSNNNAWKDVDCLCIGTGRFLRAVLVPLLTRNGSCPHSTLLVQPRGRSFVDAMSKDGATYYEIDTVLRDGTLESSTYPVAGAFTWHSPATTDAFYRIGLPPCAARIRSLGLGVAEAGLQSPDTPIMQALYYLLTQMKHYRQQYFQEQQQQSSDATTTTTSSSTSNSSSPSSLPKLCVIDMDNVPHNGVTIQRHMQTLACRDKERDASMRLFLESQVVFLDTMVDRITSQREGSHGLVPQAEPVPPKALVILDPHGDLPDWMVRQQQVQGATNDNDDDEDHLGLVIRTNPADLQADLALKLRIANGTHTALAHVMALLQITMTDTLAQYDIDTTTTTTANTATSVASTLMAYVDALVEDQILPAAVGTGVARSVDAQAVWDDWRQRLTHAHFGLSTFFITQNGPAKGGIRLGPTIVDLLNLNSSSRQYSAGGMESDGGGGITVTMAYALAALLRISSDAWRCRWFCRWLRVRRGTVPNPMP